MLWGISRNSECWSFQTFAIVFSTPKNLLVEVSGALGMKESHFLSKNVFWENGVGYLRNSKCWRFQTFAIVFSTPKNLLVEVSGALGMKVSHFLSKNVFWENAELGLSAKFCVVVCKSSLLWYWEGPSAKVGSSAKFCVVVCKSSLLWYQGGHWPKKVCLPSLV